MHDDNFIRQSDKKPYVIAICSGKGGIGKSVLTANLAYSLSLSQLSVLIWDADVQFPNQHILFGVEPLCRLNDVYNHKVKFEKVIYSISDNLSLMADMPALGDIRSYNEPVIVNLFNEISKKNDIDIIIIDCPSGSSFEVLQSCSIADLVGIVVNDEPTSLLDAYGLIKILLPYVEMKKTSLIVNNVIDSEDAEDISVKLNLATKKFLDVLVDILGFVPYDRLVRSSIVRQELFMVTSPESELAASLLNLSETIISRFEMTRNLLIN